MKSKILLICLFALSLLLTINVSPTQGVSFPLYVDAGSSDTYTDSKGNSYLPDQIWSAGSWGFVNGTNRDVIGFDVYATGGTDKKPIYATQRVGWTEFRVSNVSNQSYLVKLHFREELGHGPNINIFTIRSEGVVVVDELDVYANAGRDYALTVQFVTTPIDGELNIQAQVSEGRTFISAIEINPINDSGNKPGTPRNVIGQNSYDGNQVDWAPVTSTDLMGYNIYRSTDNVNFARINPKTVYLSRYQDSTAEPNTLYYYYVKSIDVFGLESDASDTVSAQRLNVENATLPVLDLTISPEDWQLMNAFPFAEKTVDGTLLFEGESYDVTTRYRGAGSRGTNKKNWKIKFQDRTPFPGRDSLNVNADNMDYSYIRGPLSYKFLDEMGIDAAQHQFVLFFVNGIYMGVYNDYEQIDENYLTRTGRYDDTTIYKAKNNLFSDLNGAADYENSYEKNNNRSTGHSEIIELIESLSGADDDLFPWLLQKKLDIKSYLDIYAFTVWVGNFDAFNGNNYLLYDGAADQWEMIPWDYDFAFGNNISAFGFNPLGNDIDLGMEPGKILPTRGVNVPQYRQYYCQRLKDVSSEILTPATINPEVNGMITQILGDARRDWHKIGWEDSDQLLDVPVEIAEYYVARKARLNSQIPGYCDAYDRPYLVINEVVPANDGDFCDEADGENAGCSDDWLEIYNLGLLPVDLNGFYLSDTRSNLTKHKINGSIIVPPLGHVILWADGQPEQGAAHLSFELNENYSDLYLSDPSGKEIDLINWDNLALGHSVMRLPDGTDSLKIGAAPTHGSENSYTSPVVSNLTSSPNIVTSSSTVFVSAEITDEGSFEPKLNYQINGNGFLTIDMFKTNGDRWLAALGPRPDGSRVQYFISAEDEDGLIKTEPSKAPDDVYEYVVGYEPPQIYINEIMASNQGVYFDPDEEGETPDYVELYNPGPWAVNLAGMQVTDNLTNTTRYQLGQAQQIDDFILPAGEFVLILADDDGTQGKNHIGFKLSKDGESFGIFDRIDLGNQQIDAHTFGPQTTNVAIGRCADGGEWEVLDFFSPGRSNNSCNNQPPQLSDFTQTPRYPTASTSNAIKFEIKGSDDKSISEIILRYRPEGGQWSDANMSLRGSTYTAWIPGVSQRGLIIEYYIQATDSNGAISTYPLGAPQRLNRFMYHTSDPENFPEYAVPPSLRFTELVANPIFYGIQDPDEFGERAPWIELFNGSNREVDLSGYILDHDLFFPHRHVIAEGVTIPARGYITLLLDDDPEQGAHHVAFKPVRSGDTINLYTPSQILVESVTYGSELENGSVYTFYDQSWNVGQCSTPGLENEAECEFAIFLPFIIR